jgi:hypothetical protein
MSKFQKLEGRVSLYTVLGLLGGLFVLQCISPEQSFAFESAKKAIQEICGHMEGNLGGLLMTTAGVGALVAAAFGNFRASHSMLITAIGAATVSTILSLYFADAAQECRGQGHDINTDAGAGARTLDERFALPGVLRQDAAALGDANVEIAAGRDADFTQAAQFNHGGDEFELNTEDDGGLNDLADTF